MAESPWQMGYKFGSGVRKMFTGSDGLIIAHRLPGRRRYTCERIKGDKELCTELETLIYKFPGVKTARVNPVLGSITVAYEQEEKVMDALVDTISHQIAGKHAQQEESSIPSNILTASDNLTDSIRNLRMKVCGFFNHQEPMFFTRLGGLALFGYGVYRIYSGDRPSGTQMFLWGLAILMRQSHPDPKKVIARSAMEQQQPRL